LDCLHSGLRAFHLNIKIFTQNKAIFISWSLKSYAPRAGVLSLDLHSSPKTMVFLLLVVVGLFIYFFGENGI
jgi:hypothetical protein